MLIGAFGLFEWALAQGESVAAARTVAVNAIVFVQVAYLLNCRSLDRSMFAIGVFSNRWVPAGAGAMLGLQLLFTYTPWMNQLFHSAPIGLEWWLWTTAIGVAVYVLIEAEKWIRRRVAGRMAAPSATR